MAENKVPQLTAEERAAALAIASVNRTKRAEVKQQLRDRKITVAEVIDMKDDPAIGKMLVRDLIRSVPHYGDAKAPRIMEEIGIASNRRIKGLGCKQAAALIEWLSS